MAKRKADCTPEEWDRQKAMSRERNSRYLAKGDATVIARRKAASKAYVERLATDPTYAEKLADRKSKAVVRTKIWQSENRDKVNQSARASRQRNPAREVAKVQRRNASKLQAVPKWADHEKIKRHYENARYLTEVTGHMHHVDHIIPLRSKEVCGLHVENNLRAIPHYLNNRKSNKLIGA